MDTCPALAAMEVEVVEGVVEVVVEAVVVVVEAVGVEEEVEVVSKITI